MWSFQCLSLMAQKPNHMEGFEHTETAVSKLDFVFFFFVGVLKCAFDMNATRQQNEELKEKKYIYDKYSHLYVKK